MKSFKISRKQSVFQFHALKEDEMRRIVLETILWWIEKHLENFFTTSSSFSVCPRRITISGELKTWNRPKFLIAIVLYIEDQDKQEIKELYCKGHCLHSEVSWWRYNIAVLSEYRKENYEITDLWLWTTFKNKLTCWYLNNICVQYVNAWKRDSVWCKGLVATKNKRFSRTN